MSKKNARCRSLPQKLSAATSSLAPSSLLAVRWIRCSSVIGCRGGSVPTLWQTSLKNSAVMSRSSLWRMEGKPPWGQLKACSTVNCLPQEHWRGRFEGYQPYLRQRASRKALLCNAKPCSEIGSVDSRLEPPFSVDKFIALCMVLGSLSFSSAAACD